MRKTATLHGTGNGVADQIERASRSMLLNIAELVAMKGGADPLWAVRTARCSQEETQLYMTLSQNRVG